MAAPADDKASTQSRVWRGLFCRSNDRHTGHHEICIIKPARGYIKDRLRLDEDLCLGSARDSGDFLNFERVEGIGAPPIDEIICTDTFGVALNAGNLNSPCTTRFEVEGVSSTEAQ